MRPKDEGEAKQERRTGKVEDRRGKLFKKLKIKTGRKRRGRG